MTVAVDSPVADSASASASAPPRPSALRKRMPLLVALAVGGAALLAWQAWQRSRPYEWSGTVEARDISVGSKVGGRVKAVMVQEGDRVSEGQPLVQIDPERQSAATTLVREQRVGRQATGFKKLQSRIANAVRSVVLRDGTRDTGCGLKAFRRDLFLALPYFDGLHRFLPSLARREGYDIAYVDVVDRPRRAGTSNYGMWDRLWIGILDLFGVWWLIRRRRIANVLEVKRNAD